MHSHSASTTSSLPDFNGSTAELIHNNCLQVINNIDHLIVGAVNNNSDLNNDPVNILHIFLSKSLLYYLPFVILFGIFGNSFLIVTISLSHLRTVPSNHYLIALAASDSVFLATLGIIWIKKLNVNLYDVDLVCQSVILLLSTSNWFSTWLMVALTVERYIAVYHPLRRLTATVRRTQVAIVGIIPGVVLCNIWVVFLSGITDMGVCDMLPQHYWPALIMNTFDTILALLLPTLLIVGFNVAIGFKIISSRKQFGLESNQRVFMKGVSPTNLKISGRKRKTGLASLGSAVIDAQKEYRITKTLMMVSSMFVAMNFPSYVMRCRNFFIATFYESPPIVTDGEIFCYTIFLLLYYSTFAANVLIYSVSSREFRASTKRIWLRLLFMKRRGGGSGLSHPFSHGSVYWSRTYGGGSLRFRRFMSHLTPFIDANVHLTVGQSETVDFFNNKCEISHGGMTTDNYLLEEIE